MDGLTAVGRGLFKRLTPRGLLGRSLLIIVVPLVLLQVVSAFVFYENHWHQVTRRLALALASEVDLVMGMFERMPGAENHAQVINLAERLRMDIALEPGGALPPEPPRREGSYRESKLTSFLDILLDEPFQVDLTSERGTIQILVEASEGLLHVRVPRTRLDSVTTYVFVLWMVGTSLLLFGVATIFMRNQVRSVSRLAAAAESFGKGRDIPDFKPEGAAEVRQAASAFLLMRERIKRQIAQRTEMLAGVSHDLRTPLTRMKLQLELMGDVDGAAELRADVAEMQRMVEGYLAFARGDGREPVRPVDLAELIEEVAARFRRDGAAIAVAIDGALRVGLRRHAFDRCLTNLFANALRYGGRVEVAAAAADGVVEVVIDDDGPGIPPDKREEVFRAFYRLEGSRNPSTGGTGLGLTIVRDTVRGMGGEVALEESPLGGLRVRLRLPL